MTYETHIVAREGSMTPQQLNPDGTEAEASEHVAVLSRAVAFDPETGLSADGEGATDDEARADAEAKLADKIEAVS